MISTAAFRIGNLRGQVIFRHRIIFDCFFIPGLPYFQEVRCMSAIAGNAASQYSYFSTHIVKSPPFVAA